MGMITCVLAEWGQDGLFAKETKIRGKKTMPPCHDSKRGSNPCMLLREHFIKRGHANLK